MFGSLDSITEGLTITTYKDWLVFKRRLDDLVHCGKARQIPPPTGRASRDEEWYLDVATGAIYRYGIPDAPMLPEWEKVDLHEAEQEIPDNFVKDLGGIPKGNMSLEEAQSLKTVIEFMVRDGRVEVLPPRGPSMITGAKETWYRDRLTGGIYRLAEIDREQGGRWEQMPLDDNMGKIQ